MLFNEVGAIKAFAAGCLVIFAPEAIIEYNNKSIINSIEIESTNDV
jgi:hypothetical protein